MLGWIETHHIITRMNISKKEYEGYKRYLKDRESGKILTPDSLRLICASCNNNAEEIGKQVFMALARMEGK